MTPKVLVIRILEACDAGCFMCPFRHSTDAYRYPLAEAEALAATAAGSGIRVVRFTGGEPLLHADVVALVAAFASRGLLVSIITNGSHLAEKCANLEMAGLSQVIVSLDGRGESHDRFRDHPGLFAAAVGGIAEVRRTTSIHTRVNTVVGPHNLHELADIHDLLCDLGVESWSIIPLKRADGAWEYHSPAETRRHYDEFVRRIAARPGKLRILGFGSQWIGRTDEEQHEFFEGQKIMTPHGRCGVVDVVRYYTPREGTYYVCNCVPHRIGSQELSQRWTPAALSAEGLGEAGRWLQENGPTQCVGCEPINAALGEGAIDTDADPFGF